jgi:hypothetical protein
LCCWNGKSADDHLSPYWGMGRADKLASGFKEVVNKVGKHAPRRRYASHRHIAGK